MKLVRKILPVDVYDIGGTESYLSDMAAQGLFLKRIGTFIMKSVSHSGCSTA